MWLLLILKEEKKKERSNTVDSYVNFFLSLSKRNNLDSQSHHVGRNFPLGTYVWPVEHHSIILLPPREWDFHHVSESLTHVVALVEVELWDPTDTAYL